MNSTVNSTRSNLQMTLLGSDAKFGTSGFRGKVSDLSDLRCYVCVRAFLAMLAARGEFSSGTGVALGRDLRSSSPRISAACSAAIDDAGGRPLDAGAVSSPALTLYGLAQKIPTVMVTGSHIPDDRNGIKFTTRAGEITKADEASILSAEVTIPAGAFNEQGMIARCGVSTDVSTSVWREYLSRYVRFAPGQPLKSLRIGVYQHSAVARDFLIELYRELGAEVLPFGRSDAFVPVDTEAIRPEDQELGRRWAAENSVTALVSADGDSDRPLFAGADGRWLRGDVLGILAAKFLRADAVVTPVSSNTAVERCQAFSRVVRTRIGSPYVIDAMQKCIKDSGVVVGYEANGGFLLQSDIYREGKTVLSALPSRDAVLPQLAVLLLMQQERCSVSDLLARLPQRFTASDRLSEIPSQVSVAWLKDLWGSGAAAAVGLVQQALVPAGLSTVASVDNTDGVRATLENGEILHLRGSGNAPELRCYAEASSEGRARELVRQGLLVARETLKK